MRVTIFENGGAYPDGLPLGVNLIAETEEDRKVIEHFWSGGIKMNGLSNEPSLQLSRLELTGQSRGAYTKACEGVDGTTTAGDQALLTAARYRAMHSAGLGEPHWRTEQLDQAVKHLELALRTVCGYCGGGVDPKDFERAGPVRCEGCGYVLRGEIPIPPGAIVHFGETYEGESGRKPVPALIVNGKPWHHGREGRITLRP